MATRKPGISLRSALPSLRDPQKRWAQIMNATERNSVIEGLPTFTKAQKMSILDRLRSLASHS